MAKTNNKPGPKPDTHKVYAVKQREYHFHLPPETARRFDEVAKSHGGVVKYMRELVLSQPEMQQHEEG